MVIQSFAESGGDEGKLGAVVEFEISNWRVFCVRTGKTVHCRIGGRDHQP